MNFDPESLGLAYLERLAALDAEGMREHLAADARCWIPGVGWMKGEQLIGFLSGAQDLLADGFRFEHVGTIQEENRVALEMKGDSPLTKGGSYVNEYCFVFTFNDEGKIVESREYADSAPAAAAFAPA